MSARKRTILVWVLLVLGTIVVLVGSLTVWVKRQGLDTDSWVNTSSRLLEDDDVRGALSIYIVDELYANLDPQGTLEDQLPENLQGLAGPIAGALRQPAVEGVDRFLQRPRVQDLWERANRAAHEALLRVLEDETRAGISTAGGVVTLDLRTLLVSIGEELGFGERLDSRLPETAGQITILQSDQLEAAQTGVKVLKVLSWLIILVAIALFAGAVWLARRRRETLRNVGAVLVLVGIVLLVIRRVVGNYIVDALSSGESVRDAIGSTWVIGTDLLAEVAWALIIYGLVILIGTVLAGPWRYSRSARGALAPNFRARPEFGWAVLAGLYLLLILWGPVPALRNWLGVIILGALIALGFEAFRRVVLSESEPGETRRLESPPAPAA
jgi:NADH:ubiquinone oxidoreductase subunit 6 (subunit J)